MIQVDCPSCGKSYRLSPQFAGKRGTCRECQAKFSIPAAASTQAPSKQPRPAKQSWAQHEVLLLLEESITFPKQPITLAHRAAGLLVACAMLVLPVIYVLFVAGVVWLTWWHAAHDYVWMSVAYGRAKVLAFGLYAGLVVGGFLWAISLIKTLFAGFGGTQAGPGLTRQNEPLLFAFADRLAERVGAPRPDVIRLSFDANASASYETSTFSLRRRSFTLTLGLPLIAGFTVSQLAGVMAHEFGHFSQRGSMLLDRLIKRVNLWFLLAAHRRDAIDALVESLLQSGSFMAIIPGFLLALLVFIGRIVLRGLMYVGLLVSASLMRRMEFDADCYEVGVVGSTAFAESSRRLIALVVAHEMAVKYVLMSQQCQYLPNDFAAFVAELADRSPRVKTKARKLIEKEQPRWLASHPPIGARIRTAKSLNLPGAFHLPVPATSLFKDFEKGSAELTISLYRLKYGPTFSSESVCSTRDAADSYLAMTNTKRLR